MAAPKLPLSNFTKGEFAPDLYARLDIPQYAAGARKLTNWIIQRQGGLKFRPGFRFVAETDSYSGQERMIPFSYDQNQGYMQLFSNLRMRLLANGGYVTESDLKITAVTKGATTLITAPFHGFVVGDRVYFDGNTGMVELNYRFGRVLTVPTADTFTVDINSTAFSNLTDSSGVVNSAPPAPSPDPAPVPLPPPVVNNPLPVTTGASGATTYAGTPSGSSGGGFLANRLLGQVREV